MSQHPGSIANATSRPPRLRLRRWCAWLLPCGLAVRVLAQTAGDYRSAASGNWNVATNWETYDGSTWIAASASPTAATAGTITIRSPHCVTNAASATADQVVVAAGATLAATANLTAADGADTDVDIYGTFLALGGTCLTINGSVVVESGGAFVHNGTSSGCVTINTGGTLRFASGGRFTLIRGGGRIPLSTWDPGSLCEMVYAAEGSKPDTAYLGQNFADFTVNCPLQAGGWDFAGRLSNHVENFTVNIGPNPGATELKLFSGSSSTANLNIGADFRILSGMVNIGSSGGPWSLTLAGNLFIGAGADLNVSGSSTLSYTMILNGTGTQNYTCAGTNRATKLNWTVNHGSTLNLNSDLPLSGVGRTLTADGIVNVNGRTILADLLAGTGTIRNEGGGNGTIVLGTANSSNTLGPSPALIDGSSGTLGLVKTGSGLLTLTAAQVFSGGLVVSNGSVVVDNPTGSASGNGPVTVYKGTLAGNGLISGPVAVEADGTLSPGSSPGRLTIENTLTLGGNTLIEVDKANGTNDQVLATSVNYGGTLTVTDLGGGLNAGDSFTIFKAGSHTGDFANVVGSPGSNLVWRFDPASGVLSVVPEAVNPPTLCYSLAGSTLTLWWVESGFKLQSQTNAVSTGLSSNWGDVIGGGASPVNVEMSPANGSVFFRLAPQ